MCYYTRIIKNRHYTKNKTNNGRVPTLPDIRIEYVPVGCGKCEACRKQKAREWMIRLQEHIKTNTNGHFITLTFSNESINELCNRTIRKTDKNTGKINQIQIKDLKGYEKDNAIATKAIRLFNERWRKQNKTAVRHWLITELGHKGTENIHLHGIIWTDDHKQIKQHWQYGYIWDGYTQKGKRLNYVNNKTITYCSKYLYKIDQRNKEYKPIILCSPGIGANYTNTPQAKYNSYNGLQTDETYRTNTGHKIALPIYYRNKLYTEQEKERLWINKLDKQERWIKGTKFDISTIQGQKTFERELQWHRQQNAILGYGNLPNLNRAEYENNRRELLIATRIQKAFKRETD